MSDVTEIEIITDENNELAIQFPTTLMDSLGWKEGDELQFIDNKDGGFTVKKVKMANIELEFTDEEYFNFLKAAHERDMTFNEWVQEAIEAMVDIAEDDPELINKLKQHGK